MNYFDCNVHDVDFDEKSSNCCGQDGTQFILCRLSVISFFHPAKFEQKITHQHVHLQRDSVIDGTAVQ
jgi:hypothetical protein